MRPELPDTPGTRRLLAGLASLAALKAMGLILVAEALARGIAALAEGAQPEIALTLWLGLGGALLRATAAWTAQALSARAGTGSKERLRARLLEAGMDAHTPAPPGEIAALATSGLDGLNAYYTRFLPALVAAPVIPLMIGARVLAADWVSALIVLLTLPLIPVFMILIGLHTQERVAAAADGLKQLSSHLLELAQGLPALIGLRRAKGKGAALAEVSERYRRTTMGTLRTAFLSGLALELIATLSVAVVAVFIGVRLVHGSMGLESGLLVLILVPECYLALREVGAAFHASEDGVEALRRVRALIQPLPAPRRGEAPGSGMVLELDGVQIRYDGGATISAPKLSLRPGEAHVLDGVSGTGKTTILRHVLGLTPAGAQVAGTVRVARRANGSPQAAWIPQHPRFTEGTVSAELGLAAGGALGAAEVEALLSRAALPGYAARDPHTLSPGELRRLAVARAVAALTHQAEADGGPARLLVADEPTAHLDPVSAEAVRRTLAGLEGVALLVATHDRALAARLKSRAPEETGAAEADTPQSAASQGPDTPEETAAGADSVPPAPARKPHHRRHSLALLRTLPIWGRSGLSTGVLLAAGAVAFGAALSGVSGWLIVNASYQPPMLHLMVAVVGVRFFGIGRALLRYLEQLAVHGAVLGWAGRLRERLWEALSANPRHWGPLTRGGGALGLLVQRVDSVRDALPRAVVPPAAALFTWAGAVAAFALWVPGAVLPTFVLGALGLLALPATVALAERSSGRRSAAHQAWVGGRVPVLLRAAADLGAHGVREDALRAFTVADIRGGRHERRSQAVGGIALAGAALFSAAAAVVTVLLGAAAGTMTGAQAAVAALTLLALGEPIAQTALSAQRARDLGEGLGVIGGFLAPGAHPMVAADLSASSPGQIRGIRLVDATVGWDPGQPVLRTLSLQARPGQWSTLRGPSGSGKSTALAVLLGALPLWEGRVEVLHQDGWRRLSPADAERVAWCPQEAHLFDSTVRRNLGLGRALDDQPTDDELVEALRRVGLGPWLATAAFGLETRIGAGGHRLSGGQRQRLAVARALLARADVVLLDEPTAHLGDDEAADLLNDLRDALTDCSVVLVTHDQRERSELTSVKSGLISC